MVEKLKRDYGIDYVQAWGMTEAARAARCRACGPAPSISATRRNSTGARCRAAPASATALRIVDDGGNELPRDGKTVGHLRARGPWVASGYMKLDEGLDRDGWLITGDMAVIDSQGHVTLTDRSKDVIKSGGEWISSIQLEDVALSHPDVLQAAVVAINHEKWQERPLLLVVRKKGATVDGKTLLDHMRPKIASWWMPDAVEFLDEFPMTGTGKVLKSALREKFRDIASPNTRTACAVFIFW